MFSTITVLMLQNVSIMGRKCPLESTTKIKYQNQMFVQNKTMQEHKPSNCFDIQKHKMLP